MTVLALMMAAAMLQSAPRREALAALHTARLASFRDDPSACRAALSAAGFGVSATPDLQAGGGCGYSGAIALTRSVHAYSQPVAARCALAAGLVLWERDVVAPAARRYLGQPVARIELAAPAYQCRRIGGRADQRMSEHAGANAIDIGGFTLTDGRSLSVEAGWSGPTRERAFLRAVRDGACDHFAVVLSPDYNRAHRDHFHFDLGDEAVCS